MGCGRRLHEELKAVGDSTRLAAQVAACAGKALRLLADKAEYMTATGGALQPVSTHRGWAACF